MMYNEKATDWLADSIRPIFCPKDRTKVDYDGIEKLWTYHPRASHQQTILDIATALDDGADPNPIPGKSLLAVLCLCPLEGSKELIACIRTAVALGADVKTPLIYDRAGAQNHMDNGYSIVDSPISGMFQCVNPKEAASRMDALFSQMPDADIQSIFCPCPPSGTNKICIIEPLLCNDVSFDNFKALMKHVEKIKSPAIRKTIVDASIEISDGMRTYVRDETYAWALRNRVDPAIRFRLGYTPMHECIRLVRDSYSSDRFLILPTLLEQLSKNMANAAARNTDGLTPYGLACTLGIADRFPPSIFGSDPSNEFSFRDRAGRLLPTHILDEINPYDPSDLDICIVRAMLSEYVKCHNLEKHDKAEITDVLSHAMAQAATRSNANSAALVEMLLDAGADPNYALPGELPLWQKTMLTFGDNPISNLLVKNVPDPTGEVREWAAHYGIECDVAEPQEIEMER